MLLVFVHMLVWLLIVPRALLLARTGSLFYHEYEWYSRAHAAERAFPQYFSTDPAMGQQTLTKEALRALEINRCPDMGHERYDMQPREQVGALIDPATLRATTATPEQSEGEPAPQQQQQPRFDTELYVVVGRKGLTLFPWLWDSILVNHTSVVAAAASSSPAASLELQPTPQRCSAWPVFNDCHRCSAAEEDAEDAGPSATASCVKDFPSQRLRVRLVSYPIAPRILPRIRTLLFVTDVFEHLGEMLHEFDTAPKYAAYRPRSQLRVAMLLLADEECTGRYSWQDVRQQLGPRFSFLMQPYGDCRLDPQWAAPNRT